MKLSAVFDRFVHILAVHVYSDQVRIMELVSIMVMIGWAIFLFNFPEALLRPSYAGLSLMPPFAWGILFSAVSIVQLVALAWHGRYSRDIRFGAMAVAAGLWTVIAITFWSNALPSTADVTYAALAIGCFLAGIWLAWTSKNYS